MPCVTYMDDFEYIELRYAMDPEMRKLCDEVRDLTGMVFAVGKTTQAVGRSGVWPFRKTDTLERYTVYLRLPDTPEAQCINLLTGLGGGYSRAEAGAFLIGVRLLASSGRHRGRRRERGVPLRDAEDGAGGMASVELTGRQIAELHALVGDDPTAPVTVHRAPMGHSGPGLYAWFSENTEEGAVFLGGASDVRPCSFTEEWCISRARSEGASDPTTGQPEAAGSRPCTCGERPSMMQCQDCLPGSEAPEGTYCSDGEHPGCVCTDGAWPACKKDVRAADNLRAVITQMRDVVREADEELHATAYAVHRKLQALLAQTAELSMGGDNE